MAERPISDEHIEYAMETVGVSWWGWNILEDTIDIFGQGDCLLGQGCLQDQRGRADWLEEVHPEDREKVERSLEACLRGEVSEWKCEHRFRTTEGGWLWVLNQGYVRDRDKKGNPLFIRGITQNTDRLKKALTEAYNHKILLDTSDKVLELTSWDYDPQTDTILWSEGIERILEVDEGYVPSVENTYNMVVGSDRERLIRAFEQLKADGTGYDLQLHFKTGKGRDILCRTIARARFNDKGEIVRIVGAFQDITGVVKLEHEMSAFFSHTPDFHATLSFEAEFKFFNDSWAEKFGCSSDELSGSCLYEVIVPEDREAFKATFEKVVLGGSITSYESRVLGKEGRDSSPVAKEAWMSWSLSCDPELKLVFVTARCVTEQKRAEQALQDARIQAEEANRAKSDFLAVMSHELRTPLNPILGFADMLVEEVESKEHRKILKTIVESGKQMLSLINEILDYSKIDAGKAELEPVEFSLEDFVLHKVELMSGQITGSQIKLEHSIDFGPLDPKDCPVLIGDVGMLRQVCRNLLSNAIKFTSEGRIDFLAKVKEADTDRAIVEFSVKDTGVGIPAAHMNKLFQPFSQVDSSMTRKYEGTGLGLAICKRLLNLMDGTITVESELNQGSIFTFTVPLKLRRSSSRDIARSGPGEGKEEEKSIVTGNVLLVEDNESNAFYAKTLVELSGAKIELAEDGETALKMMAENCYDLVLLDLHMPGIGGLEALKRIRALEKDEGKDMQPIIVLTADAGEKAKKDCAKFGAQGLLIKPINPVDLTRVLEQHLKLL